MKTGNFLILALIISVSVIGGCTPNAKYERMLKRELAKGTRCDSLFMGLYLGMQQKDFYARCWELNKTGLIKQGEGNMSVEYKMKNELKHQAFMNFYPKFADGKISEMPVKYKYAGWAPWNKALSSEKLQLDLLSYYEKLYGKGFMTVRSKIMGNAFVKIDGNRRITLYRTDDLYVYATFTDLTVKNDTLNVQKPDSIKTTVSNSEKKANE